MTAYSTLAEFMKMSSTTQVSYHNLSFIDILDNIKFPVYNVFMDYIDFVKKYAFDVTLTDSEYNKYVYKPKLLAGDVYGDTEYYFIILALNGICNVKEFDMKTIKMLKKDDLIYIITRIYKAESTSLIEYNSKNAS